ncbi:MAG TPA: galactose-1-phosphate uridylyltransferase [Candidatus Latescibacteria bacterium]|nr:galactose-1-phosphate uridylyltransferase [Candidatus Latescibacterota bacterium]HPC43601.1 galactose-1-phosphate uridylyltransferase [Candidatus Latescibacterota bacterium]HQK21892.1 galactose-1-phosphate uridylyltransferase [Candidatus Latescibacterota bacterium]
MQELRKDPVTDRWVIVSTERGARPTDFESLPRPKAPQLCPFCYGFESTTPPEIYCVREAGTAPNTPGWSVRVVPNKFPALRIEGNLVREGVGMFDKMTGIGAHEVIIEHPDHQRRFWDFSVQDIERVLAAYLQRTNDLKRDIRLRHMLVFKNEGEQAGASVAHSHSQLIATPVVPKRVREKLDGVNRYLSYKERCVYCDEIREEQRFGERVVFENDSFISFCPFASRFPFEVTLLPKTHRPDFSAIDGTERTALAEALRVTMRKLNEALNGPQYNWIFLAAPTRLSGRESWEDFHWHVEIIPRLTKIAGFEWGTGFYINPTPPEHAAAYLRGVAGCGSPGLD